MFFLRKRSTVCSCALLFALVFVVTSLIACLPVFAESFDELMSRAKTELKHPIKYGIFTILAYGKMGLYSSLESIDFIFNLSVPGDVLPIITGIEGALTTIGRLLCFVYFLLDLLEHATRDTFTAEAFVKSFAKLIILFVIFSPETLNTITQFGAGLNDLVFEKISKGIGDGAVSALSSLLDEMKKTSWIKCIGFLFQMDRTLPALTMLISIVVALFIGVGRMIELGVYRAMLPLGICSIYNGGVNSSGFRYVKKLIALELQGSIMFLTLVIGSYVAQEIGDSSSVGGLIGGMATLVDLAFSLATCAIIVRSKSIANDVVGV